MTRILIADAGSTKTDWVLLSGNARERRVSTIGYNALLTSEEAACTLFASVREAIGSEPVDIVYLYGAGCATEQICRNVEEMLCRQIGATRAVAASDLLGAARGSAVREPGIACILGTGSNSCLYDGEKIVCNTPSLGFILGDEGSGSALGKQLVADIYKGVLPADICEMFKQKTGLTVAEILDRVYRQPAANRFVASFVPFIKENIEHPSLRNMVKQEFIRFFSRNISRYEGAHTLPVNFTGGIANAFADILKETATEAGYHIGKIVKSPLEGLIAYHKAETGN